jgi:hypothetical protein
MVSWGGTSTTSATTVNTTTAPLAWGGVQSTADSIDSTMISEPAAASWGGMVPASTVSTTASRANDAPGGNEFSSAPSGYQDSAMTPRPLHNN